MHKVFIIYIYNIYIYIFEDLVLGCNVTELRELVFDVKKSATYSKYISQSRY